MNLDDLITKFSGSATQQRKAIFSTLFIAGNKLQTLFDKNIPEVSLKQFMLLSIVRKLSDALMKKGFVTIQQSSSDPRALCICPTEKVNAYFQNSFAKYQEDLKYLFDVYTEEETETLFWLLSKLYAGIENLEKESSADENHRNL